MCWQTRKGAAGRRIVRGTTASIATTKSVVIKLLKRLRDFNEWSQCLILSVVAEFKPENEQEMYEVMNFLDERLRHCNAALVVAAVKVACVIASCRHVCVSEC